MFKTSNFLKSTLLRRSNVIHRYSYGQCIRNLSTQKDATNKGSKAILSKFADLIVYDAKVVKEIAKEVYIKENLGPPNGIQVTEAWENLKSIRWNNINDFNPKDFIRISIRSVEVAGFFVLGEMIGRFSIIGYNL